MSSATASECNKKTIEMRQGEDDSSVLVKDWTVFWGIEGCFLLGFFISRVFSLNSGGHGKKKGVYKCIVNAIQNHGFVMKPLF